MNILQEDVAEIKQSVVGDVSDPENLMVLGFSALVQLINERFQELSDKIDRLDGGGGGSGGGGGFGSSGGGSFNPDSGSDTLGFGFLGGFL